jgi:hypothetical protein
MVQSLNKDKETEIAVQVHQLYFTRRTLLPHHALHIGAMGIEVVRYIHNENTPPWRGAAAGVGSDVESRIGERLDATSSKRQRATATEHIITAGKIT